jgi:cation diffusion facilitator CzcD-associated flavoprotein CzcO
MTEHVDVLIVGAGLSGVDAGYHLQRYLPGKSYTIFEARDTIGGTWDLFRYPGVRSDSDMYTLGYSFRPWRNDKSIGDGTSILSYVRDTAQAYGIDRKIRFHHRVTRAQWSSADATWTVDAERSDTGEAVRVTCGFLFMCTGYYRYDEGYTPQFPGVERFGGQIVHPQFWTDNVDYAGKRVVVIGSGATAVTLVPALAPEAGHVTMLQRSPSYVLSLPVEDPVLTAARRVLGARAAYALTRWKNVFATILLFQLSRRRPKTMKKLFRKLLEQQLPAGYDVDAHFTPAYDPWDQRLCLVPDGDLFQAISNGSVSIVTDRIKTFTESGIELESGSKLDADLVVTATGLNLLAIGGVELEVDGDPVAIRDRMVYKGMMLSGVPNFAFAFGYTNASWTLKADLTCKYVTRILQHMDANGHRQAVPHQRDESVTSLPFMDLSSGYVQRSIEQFPQQGSRKPWRLYQNYALDVLTLKFGSLQDDVLEFSSPRPVAAPAGEPVAA